MASKNLMKFEEAMANMDPLQVTDYLQKTLDFLKRNNSEVYFPSISPYVEAFLVNLVSDTRNLKCKSFQYDDRVLAAEIIELLEMSRELFRWTHVYESGNLLVYKKIFSNKMMKKPIKLSAIADRLIQARASDLRNPKPQSSNPQAQPAAPRRISTADPKQSSNPRPRPAAHPKNGIFTTSFKLRFLNTTLQFVKNEQSTLTYPEMPLSQAEYIYNLLRYRDKDVGFGYKSLYAQLWEAMEEYETDYKFEVTLKETSNEKAVLVLEKVPKNSNKPKKETGSAKITNNENENTNDTNMDRELLKSSCNENKDSKEAVDQALHNFFLDPCYTEEFASHPSLGSLNITEKFFRSTVHSATEFADNENCKIITFNNLLEEEMRFVKELRVLAESTEVREMFMPKYRILLWKLDRNLKKALKNCDVTATVDEKDRNGTESPFPPLDQLSNISEPFFKETVAALTNFADYESSASHTFHGLSNEQILFVKGIKKLAGSSKMRELFDPLHRDLLWRLNYSINQSMETCKITTTVNEKDRSITLKKTPKFSTPAPVTPSAAANAGRSKSMVSTKTRDRSRSISKDRLIQFEKGGKNPTTSAAGVEATDTEPQQESGRSREGMSKRAAKLLEDLSTPVESDRGMRMMLLMGWDGGALGARGDGIIEPVMPHIDMPKRGGLGHVPPTKPAKVTPRRPIDFRLHLLHNIHDLLLHADKQKELQYKDPLARKECKFVRHSLQCFNNKTNITLTEKENDLVAAISEELKKSPGLEIRAEVAQDLRVVTLLKGLKVQPAKIPKLKSVKVKTKTKVKLHTDIPQNISDEDVDVIIKCEEVNAVIPYVDVSDLTDPPSDKVIKKRATRLFFLSKFAEVLSLDWRGQIVYKYEGVLLKKTKAFLKEVMQNLNADAWNGRLLRGEAQVFEDLLNISRGSLVSLDFRHKSKFVLTRQPLINEDYVGPKLGVNNNDEKTGNRNKTVKTNPIIATIDLTEKDNENELKTNIYTSDKSENLVQTIEKDVNYPNVDIDMNNHFESNGDIEYASLGNNNVDKISGSLENSQRLIQAVIKDSDNPIVDIDLNDSEKYGVKRINYTEKEGLHICKTNKISESLENINLDRENTVEFHHLNTSVENDQTVKTIVKKEPGSIRETNSNKETDNMIYIGDIKKELIKSEDNIPESDLDRDIRELEMTILNAKTDMACNIKTEQSSDINPSDLEMDISEYDLNFNIKQEIDDSNVTGKRSHSNSICSQELDPKKTKVAVESDENVMKIMPKNPDENMTNDTIKAFQTVIAKELDKSGSFLPLLKCLGAQNGGLIYICHDEDDVAWLKKVISDANLDLKIVSNKDVRLEKKSRELLIKINSYIPLDTKTTFRKFEIYNVGLETKFWKVTSEHVTDDFVIFMVTVDEKSFKYISNEKFSLYCGIDKAQFSVIF